MTFFASRLRVFNRGVISDEFLTELVEWAKTAPDEIFAKNSNYDIYSKVFAELGPFPDLATRKAVMVIVLAVLGMFEASGKNWREGIDASRHSETTNETAEAGMWQVSWNNRYLDQSLRTFLSSHGINDGATFQQVMKSDHPLAMEFAARLLRIDVKDYDRINNGPVRKIDGYGGINERQMTWPTRQKLWHAEESIYPWLSRSAVDEIKTKLT